MTNTRKDDRPAFPTHETEQVEADPGMTLRQYAAIHLEVPDSGLDWLDAMILEAKRDEIAARSMSYAAANERQPQAARVAYGYADAMLAARARGEGGDNG